MSTMRAARPLRVIKFGGSSVGSADGFIGSGKVVTSHLSSGTDVVCVLSAMFGVTNQLITAAKAAERNDLRGVEALRSSVFLLHQQASENLPLKSKTRQSLQEELQNVFKLYFDPTVKEVAGSRTCSLAHMDLISSIGERLSTIVMAAYLRDHGIIASEVATDNLLITTGEHGSGVPDMEETRKRLVPLVREKLQAGLVPCVTGFIGTSHAGKTTTLGRGGSDLTASTLANVLDAEEVILSKVEYEEQSNGWMGAWQPGWVGFVHHCDVSQTITTISYEEAAELAHFQRKVLHHGAVYPAMDKDIPIRVSNTLDYTHPGTLIIPSLKLQPRVCEVTTLLLSTYETSTKTEIASSGYDGDKSTRGLVVLVGLRVAQVYMVRQRISQALDTAKIKFSFANLNRETSLALVVDSTVMKQAAKIMHVTFVAQPVSKRWLIPSRHPVDEHVAAHTGAGWA